MSGFILLLAAHDVISQRYRQRRYRSRKVYSHRHLLQGVSLRVKLLIGFSIAFSLVFAGAYYWFYTFATEKAIARLADDLRDSLEGAVKGTDVEELEQLYKTGQANAQGFSDDPRYLKQLEWFETVHQIEPNVWLYSYIVGPASQNRRVGEPSVAPEQLEIVYLVDLWSKYDTAKAARFLESEPIGSAAYKVYHSQQSYESTEIYEDRWGTWLSAAAPLKDEAGNLVAVLGVDIEATYVRQIQSAIRQRIVASFVVTYSVLVVLLYALSGLLTNRLSKLTHVAERIGKGNYNVNLSSLSHSYFPDELNTLAQVFESMVQGIRLREQLIREGKQVEDEIRLALQEEKELNELKSRFVAMVSHELRTPLTVVRTSLELLERYGAVASEQKRKDYFQRSRIAIDHMAQMIEDVLTIGKSEAGKLDFKPLPIDLESFCRAIAEEIQMGVGANHHLMLETTDELGEVEIDPGLVRSILTNLLSNAVKYSPLHSRIDFRVFKGTELLNFEISDQGIGIPETDQPRLFELFHRASNVNAIRGTGLGLAIVKQCVAFHRGEISFVSEEGVGTTFRVKLPLHTVRQMATADGE